MVSFSRGLLVVLALVCISDVAAEASLLGSNLIKNGDAESGPGSSSGGTVSNIPNWTTSGNFTVVQYDAPGGFPTSSGPGPASRGNNFFAGGPNNGFSSASQTIDISSIASQVDTGSIVFSLTGYLGGFSNQNDNAVLKIDFLDGSASSLGVAQIGPVLASDRSNTTGLFFRSTAGNLPVGTRAIGVTLEMTRTAGSYNDGYADNLSFVLQSNAVPEPASLAMWSILGVGLVCLVRRVRS
ncbi:MAG TPA: hypothetical protein ENJ50_09750 [Planctomycetaceae bacterium]|nr:hypothetical protein [Planctomycetaceae bacterium]